MNPLHVLLIDDDEALRRTLRARLEEFGCRVTEAGDGTGAISIHESDPVDVFVCDLVMPRKEGLETIREFHRAYPAVRIIAISGAPGASEVYLEIAGRFGASTVLIKPFSGDDLARAIGVQPT